MVKLNRVLHSELTAVFCQREVVGHRENTLLIFLLPNCSKICGEGRLDNDLFSFSWHCRLPELLAGQDTELRISNKRVEGESNSHLSTASKTLVASGALKAVHNVYGSLKCELLFVCDPVWVGDSGMSGIRTIFQYIAHILCFSQQCMETHFWRFCYKQFVLCSSGPKTKL